VLGLQEGETLSPATLNYIRTLASQWSEIAARLAQGALNPHHWLPIPSHRPKSRKELDLHRHELLVTRHAAIAHDQQTFEVIQAQPVFPLPPRPLYALTRIFHYEYIQRMESAFEIIAEPNRRAILSLLVSSEQSVGEIERQLRMPQPTVSKHLRVLREAGFVQASVDAQRRLYRLTPRPLQEIDDWLAQFRRFWSAHLDALERHLDRMDQSTPKKPTTNKKRRGPNRGRDKGGTR
jgi:DNA-binding transcriptional ArsR family regulator